MATRIGMHFSLWAAAWTRESAELAVPECAKYGLEVIEIPLLAPETIDVPHARDLLARVCEEVDPATAFLGEFGTVMVAHTGPGVVGLAWRWEPTAAA